MARSYGDPSRTLGLVYQSILADSQMRHQT